MLVRWIKSPGSLTINTMHVGLHVHFFEFRLAHVALLVLLWYFIRHVMIFGVLLMYHIIKRGEITSIPVES